MTKKVTKNHNLLLFTNTREETSKANWDELVKLTSREKWEKPMGHKDVGTPVAIDNDHGNPLTHERAQFRKVELPPEFCPNCEETHVEAVQRTGRGFIMLDADYPEIGMVRGDTITHCLCDDCGDFLAFPDEVEQGKSLILTRGQRKTANRANIKANCIAYIKARQLAGETGSVLGSDTRKEAAKDRIEEIK